MRRWNPVLLAAALVAGVGCGGDPAAPVPGDLRILLGTPNGDDGAVLFTISGGPVDSVIPVGYATFTSAAGATAVRIVVAGNLSAGELVRIRVPDVGRVSAYHGAVQEVASRGVGFVLRPSASYRLTVTR